MLDIIQKCWDADPLKRPKARVLDELFNELKDKTDKDYDGYEENAIINQQIREADEINKQLPPLTTSLTGTLTYATHPLAIYTSRLLDFKELPEPKNAISNDNSLGNCSSLINKFL